MRFMMVIFRRDWPNSTKPVEIKDRAAFAAMGEYNDKLKKAGILLAMDGLTPPSMGARLTYKGGKAKITDGPFTEAKEVIAGFWMIEVKSRRDGRQTRRPTVRHVRRAPSFLRSRCRVPARTLDGGIEQKRTLLGDENAL